MWQLPCSLRALAPSAPRAASHITTSTPCVPVFSTSWWIEYCVAQVASVVRLSMNMDGPTARACLAALTLDRLLQRILAEKRRDTGYNSLVGILEEDLVQALDQIIQERLGQAAAPAERWRRADQGMHVLAAALYGMLKADGFDRSGGRIDDWMADVARHGRLASAHWQAAASAVLQVPVAQLWTTPG